MSIRLEILIFLKESISHEDLRKPRVMLYATNQGIKLTVPSNVAKPN